MSNARVCQTSYWKFCLNGFVLDPSNWIIILLLLQRFPKNKLLSQRFQQFRKRTKIQTCFCKYYRLMFVKLMGVFSIHIKNEKRFTVMFVNTCVKCTNNTASLSLTPVVWKCFWKKNSKPCLCCVTPAPWFMWTTLLLGMGIV